MTHLCTTKNHTETSKANMGRMAEAYKRHKEGLESEKKAAKVAGGGGSNKKRKVK